MLNSLTPEQEKMIAVVRDEWIKSALGGETSVDEGVLKGWLDFVYSKIGKTAPQYEIVGGPLEAQTRANKLNGNTTMEKYPSGIGLGYDSGWSAFYDYFTRIGVLNNDDFNKWSKFKDAGVWDCLLFENIAYIIRRPSLVLKDTQGRLHCENGPAVVFPNGEKFWRWHAVQVSEKLILHSEEAVRADLLAEKNSEVLRAWGEKLGWTKFFTLMDAELINDQTDSVTGLKYSLYTLKNKPSPEFAIFLKMESPELNDGTRPFYVEPVHPGLKTALAARKWKCAINSKGERPSVEECNESSELVFQREA